MALIEELVAQIPDVAMQEALGREIADLKKRTTWGLVFERHIPESTRLLAAPIKVGSVVWQRRAAKPKRFRVRGVQGDPLVVAEEDLGTSAPEIKRT
jgi:adenine-specific DNA-methyltransferase